MAEKFDEARRMKLLEDLPNFLTLYGLAKGIGPDPIVWWPRWFAMPRGAQDILVMRDGFVEMMIADVARNLRGQFKWACIPRFLRPPEISVPDEKA